LVGRRDSEVTKELGFAKLFCYWGREGLTKSGPQAFTVMNDKCTMSIGVFNVSPSKSAQVSFLGMETGVLELSVLSFADIMPASSQSGVSLKPLLLQVIKCQRVHITPKLIAKSAGSD
jgi:hypothetical protein